MHAHLDQATLVALDSCSRGIVAKTILSAKFFGNSGERLRQLCRIVGIVEARTSLVRQFVKIPISPFIVGLRAASGWNALGWKAIDYS